MLYPHWRSSKHRLETNALHVEQVGGTTCFTSWASCLMLIILEQHALSWRLTPGNNTPLREGVRLQAQRARAHARAHATRTRSRSRTRTRIGTRRHTRTRRSQPVHAHAHAQNASSTTATHKLALEPAVQPFCETLFLLHPRPTHGASDSKPASPDASPEC
eukprot:5454510-Pleurochrysis_carterae.AAC.2